MDLPAFVISITPAQLHISFELLSLIPFLLLDRWIPADLRLRQQQLELRVPSSQSTLPFQELLDTA